MSSINPDERLLDRHCEDFATSLLPLYSGPQVTIRIGSARHEYKLPKALLCKQSPYFAAMFEGSFREGNDQSATLEEIDGAVSTRSFRMLLQWICLGRVIFGDFSREEGITAAIEFARLSDMCGVTGMESAMAEHIKAIISATPASNGNPERNTHLISSRHITSASSLPCEHPVRGILAAAAVEGYIQLDNHKFLKECKEVPSFSADLLAAVKTTLKTINDQYAEIYFREPIRDEMMPFNSDDSVPI